MHSQKTTSYQRSSASVQLLKETQAECHHHGAHASGTRQTNQKNDKKSSRTVDRSIGFFQPEQIGYHVMQARERGESQGIVIKVLMFIFSYRKRGTILLLVLLGESLIRYIVPWDYSTGRLD
jgi:hypothetical protein